MKKVLSLVLTLVLIAATAVSAAAVTFPDVDENYSWAQDAISTLSQSKIITGYDDGTFKPGKSITRQEAITLFSKSLGASETVNEPVVNLAYGIYEADLAGCEDSYAVKQGAYLIYRKVLTADEVKMYLVKENRDLELKRYEAATLIAKALGADGWLKNNTVFDVTFDDKDEIPAAALGYVFYATELGIMNGMGDNLFGPNVTVTRAQIAVMISRILDTMEFDYIHGMISSVDTLMNNLNIKTDDGEVVKFTVGNSGAIYLDGEKVTLVELEVGMACVFTFSKNAIYQIDAITYEGEETVAGAYRGKVTTNAGTTIKLADITQEEAPISSYKLASNVVLNVNNGEGTLADIKSGDYVTLKMSGGLGVSLISQPRVAEVNNVKITDIQTATGGVVITVLTEDEETVAYVLADNASIIRNGSKAEFSELAIGDSANLTLDYGEISGVSAYGQEKSTAGIIDEITISNGTSYISIKADGRVSKYPMARDCEITLEGEAADAYALRLGAYVKLTVASETVTKIQSDAVSQDLTVTGAVITVNRAYNLVVIKTDTGMEKQLFLKNGVKIFDSKNGKTLSITDLKENTVITAAGTQKLNMYEVSTIMVLQ